MFCKRKLQAHFTEGKKRKIAHIGRKESIFVACEAEKRQIYFWTSFAADRTDAQSCGCFKLHLSWSSPGNAGILYFCPGIHARTGHPRTFVFCVLRQFRRFVQVLNPVWANSAQGQLSPCALNWKTPRVTIHSSDRGLLWIYTVESM